MSILAQPPATATEPSVQSDPSNSAAAPLIDTVLAALIAIGASTDTIDTARQTIATGLVSDSFFTAVRQQNNRDLLPVVDCLDEVIGRVANQQSLRPLVALIAQEKADEEQALPGHYAWCEAARCILQRYDDGDTYTEHQGPTVKASIADRYGDAVTLTAELGSDESLVDDTPKVYLQAGSDDGLILDRPGLDQAITDLETFVDGLHQLRRLMGQGKAQ